METSSGFNHLKGSSGVDVKLATPKDLYIFYIFLYAF